MEWIDPGLPGEGHLTVFDNGVDRGYSSVIELVPPIDADGSYGWLPEGGYGPGAPVWTWEDPDDFFSPFVSGAQRLANGNTLICAGATGHFVEVTFDGEIVWEYVNPITYGGPLAQGYSFPPFEQSVNGVFRAERYALDHPAFVGRTLTPIGPLEQAD